MDDLIYNSEMILNDPDDTIIYTIQDLVCSSGLSIQYKLTEGEIEWLLFVKNKYSIYDYLMSNHIEDDIFLIDDDLSKALDNDCLNAGKAVCLSDDTALQKIFFYCYQERDH